jgi:lipopolysaccharide/colanic/teichoic acid biosynthesis glycosyltransferase
MSLPGVYTLVAGGGRWIQLDDDYRTRGSNGGGRGKMTENQAQVSSGLDVGTVLVHDFRAGDLLVDDRTEEAHWRAVLKRGLDVGASLVLLLTFALPLSLIAIMIKLDSPGPIFFRVRRVGRYGEHFRMLKFRKMHHDATGGPLTVHGDPRLTRIGSLMTRTRLDELPQLWDVLCGRMSIIGPRPEDPAFVEMHRDDYDRILTVRPGITGLSQLAYKEEATIVDASRPVDDYVARILPQKLTMDKLYASAWTIKLDFEVVYWTFVTLVLKHPIAVNRVTGAMNIRRRPRVPMPGGARDTSTVSVAGDLASSARAHQRRRADVTNADVAAERDRLSG